MSGVAIACTMSAVELRCLEKAREDANVVVMRGAFLFVVVTSALLLVEAILADLRWVDFTENVAPSTFGYLFELVFVAWTTVALSATKDFKTRLIILIYSIPMIILILHYYCLFNSVVAGHKKFLMFCLEVV